MNRVVQSESTNEDGKPLESQLEEAIPTQERLVRSSSSDPPIAVTKLDRVSGRIVSVEDGSVNDEWQEHGSAHGILMEREVRGENMSEGDAQVSVNKSSNKLSPLVNRGLENAFGPEPGRNEMDHGSENLGTGDKKEMKLENGKSMSSFIYMPLLEIFGFLSRTFEPSVSPGRTRIRWRCVSDFRCALLIWKDLLIRQSQCAYDIY